MDKKIMLKHVIVSILHLLTGLDGTTSIQHDYESILRRGEKSLTWKWANVPPKSQDVQRRRRFSMNNVTEPWWKQMQTFYDYSSSGSSNSPLTLNEEPHFARISHTPPFDDLEKLPQQDEDRTGIAEDKFYQRNHYREVEEPFLGKAIIDELHRPSKLELESATRRLKEADRNKEHFRNEKSLTEQLVSSVEYVIPSIELVEPHVEYVNKFEVVMTTPTIPSSVEYVEPLVEFVEPEIEYFPRTQKSNISEKYSFVSSRDGGSELDIIPFSNENLPVEESITIDRKQLLQVFSRKKEPTASRSVELQRSRMDQNKDKTEKNRNQQRNINGRPHEVGVPVNYPTLEILPVVPFTCEGYTAPGYYADISARCQMFHICHGNGQRSSFMCPFGTVFNQEYLVCDWWYNVDCRGSHKHYSSLEAFSTSNKPIITIGSTAESRNNNSVVVNQSNHLSPLHQINRAPSNQDYKVSLLKSEMSLKNKSNKVIDYSRNRSSQPVTPKLPTINKSNRTPSNEENLRYKVTKSKSENIMENLSKKAINYPIGYAILLKELLKSSAQKHPSNKSFNQSKSEDSLQNHNTIKYLGHENTVVKITKKIQVAPRVKNFRKKKRVYIGGSKPFVAAVVKKRKITSSKTSDTVKLKEDIEVVNYRKGHGKSSLEFPELAQLSTINHSDVDNHTIDHTNDGKENNNDKNKIGNTYLVQSHWEISAPNPYFQDTLYAKLDNKTIENTRKYNIQLKEERIGKTTETLSSEENTSNLNDFNETHRKRNKDSYKEKELWLSYMINPSTVDQRIHMNYGARLNKLNNSIPFYKV